MKIPVLTPYFSWLQFKAPTGPVEVYPEISDKNESSQKNLYIAGDLTGIPLLKLAAEGGAKVIRQIHQDLKNKLQDKSSVQYDVLIIGAGPAGISAALECEKLGLHYALLESTQIFNTIKNFPAKKLILAKPDNYQSKSGLQISDGVKESLLEELNQQIQNKSLKIVNDSKVEQIESHKGVLKAITKDNEYIASKILLCIGKSGSSRKLKVPGEDLPKVFDKLFDASEFSEKKILVVGGGDSALEASIALAQNNNIVHHSYRKETFSRPKPENLEAFNKLVSDKKIIPLFNSQVESIQEKSVTLKTKEGKLDLENHVVFSLIGRELPLNFFKRSKIKMQNQKDYSWTIFLIAMLSFFTMLYFGKSGYAANLIAGNSFSEKLGNYFTLIFSHKFSFSLKGYGWYDDLNFVLGWLGSLVWLVSGAASLIIMLKQREKYFGTTWGKIKYGYLTAIALSYTYIYFNFMLGQKKGWVYEPTYYYSLFYCTTMALFGIRRALVKKTKYIRYQMASLIFIQVFFLFLLPYHLYDALIAPNFSADSYLIREMFPSGKWSSFGFILFWPLSMANFGTSTFWTWFPFVQTFGILFYLVYRYGKGSYCGWICSCGGMAETLGDEYREKSPHGPTAKKLENIGQFVLLWAFVVTGLKFAEHHLKLPPSLLSDTLQGFYKLSIDVFFAGVLGLGVYFFMGGRIWCRYGCPLAALMHIYTRFSKYRIVAEKKKCISCNACTKVCHMGIDVMNFANKGIPMNDVECVRCSSCVHSCPTEVLAFAELPGMDVKNKSRQATPEYGKEDWRAGISR